MKRALVRSLTAAFALCVTSSFATLVAHANTVTLDFQSVGGASSGGYYVYPYNFSIDNSKTLDPLMCISFKDEIYQGETWQATVDPITTFQDKEAAVLFDLASTNPSDAIDAQWAAWKLFDPSLNLSSYGLTRANRLEVDSLLLGAGLWVAFHPNDAAFYDQFEVFVPVKGSQPQGSGTPQSFIGERVPEPASFLLIGAGLFCCILFCRGKLAPKAI